MKRSSGGVPARQRLPLCDRLSRITFVTCGTSVLATIVAIAGANRASAIRARLTGKELGFMSWRALGW